MLCDLTEYDFGIEVRMSDVGDVRRVGRYLFLDIWMVPLFTYAIGRAKPTAGVKPAGFANSSLWFRKSALLNRKHSGICNKAFPYSDKTCEENVRKPRLLAFTS